MTDIKKEFEAAIRSFTMSKYGAEACYEIHKRELEALRQDLKRHAASEYLSIDHKMGLTIAIEQISRHYLKDLPSPPKE